jgi:hypothetical protein
MDTQQPSAPTAPAPPATGIVLRAVAHDGVTRLVPDQAAAFDILLENHTPDPVDVVRLDGNTTTPTVRVIDAHGAVVFAKTPGDKSARVVGERGPERAPVLRTATLAPNGTDSLKMNAGTYADPLPAGSYLFEASHAYKPAGGGELTSNRVAFEVVRAHVLDAALGYESTARMVSILAWIAQPKDPPGQKPRLLARLSGFTGHSAAQQGGTWLGDVALGSRVAVGLAPPEGPGGWLLWIAATSGDHVETVRHNMTSPAWRSGPVALPITDAVPVPRFPDRGHAVVLATGKVGAGHALTGLVVDAAAGAGKPWVVPLAAAPVLTVCAFGATGPVSVVYATDDGQRLEWHRVDVEETGHVVAADRVVRTSPLRAMAATADIRDGRPPELVLLEANRAEPDRLALVRMRLTADPPAITPIAPAPGWPSTQDGGVRRVLRADAASLEAGLDGAAHLAIVDERGRVFGGPLVEGGSLVEVTREGARRGTFPHVAAADGTTTTSFFNDDGALVHDGG